MPHDWEQIRAARPDITDWVIHWTKSRMPDQTYESPLDVLKCILRCGYLIPSFSPRKKSIHRTPRQYDPRAVSCGLFH